jgi:nicotinamidase/pyrazinamidase
MKGKSAVIVVDLQGDFTTWKNGSLAVNGTDDAYVLSVEAAARRLKEDGLLIFASQDWHPPDHISFATNHPGSKPLELIRIDGRSQMLWPPHCVQDTENARILIDNTLFQDVVRKGVHPQFDSYSAFYDDGGHTTGLENILHLHEITFLIIFGLATDYCVRATALDAISAGFRVVLIEGLCRGVAPITTAQALHQMAQKGVAVLKELDMGVISSMM